MIHDNPLYNNVKFDGKSRGLSLNAWTRNELGETQGIQFFAILHSSGVPNYNISRSWISNLFVRIMTFSLKLRENI